MGKEETVMGLGGLACIRCWVLGLVYRTEKELVPYGLGHGVCVYRYMSMWVPKATRRGHWIPGAGVTGSCGWLDRGAGN